MLNGRWFGIGYESIDAGKYFLERIGDVYVYDDRTKCRN